MVQDFEELRTLLGIEQWLLLGHWLLTHVVQEDRKLSLKFSARLPTGRPKEISDYCPSAKVLKENLNSAGDQQYGRQSHCLEHQRDNPTDPEQQKAGNCNALPRPPSRVKAHEWDNG